MKEEDGEVLESSIIRSYYPIILTVVVRVYLIVEHIYIQPERNKQDSRRYSVKTAIKWQMNTTSVIYIGSQIRET